MAAAKARLRAGGKVNASAAEEEDDGGEEEPTSNDEAEGAPPRLVRPVVSKEGDDLEERLPLFVAGAGAVTVVE